MTRRVRASFAGATPNFAQEKAIRESIANYDADPDIELLGWQAIDPHELLAEDERPKGIYVEFRYLRSGEGFDPSTVPPGREVTVFAPDGSVLDSQDFG